MITLEKMILFGMKIFTEGCKHSLEVKRNMSHNLYNKVYNKIRIISWKRKRKLYRKKESECGEGRVFSHVTYYSVGNTGDTVLSQCVRRCFSGRIEPCSWNIIELDKPVTNATIESINKTSALVIGGGGLFLPDTNENSISGWQWPVSQSQLSAVDVPVLVFSVGYNYFKGQEPSVVFKNNLVTLCEKADFIGLRNRGSVKAVRELLPIQLREKVIYQPCTTTIIRKIYGAKIEKKKPSKVIAFNLAFDRSQRRYGEYKEKICTEVAKAAKSIENLGYEIVLVYHCSSDSEIRHYMDEQHVSYKVKDLTFAFPGEVYEFYNKVECVLGMRGHAQMIPFGLNCCIISLGTHDKMRWFLEDIDAVDWYVELNNDIQTLANRILTAFKNSVVDNKEETHRRLIEAQEKLWIITQRNMKQIQDIVNKWGGVCK